MNGFYIVNKQKGITSHTVCNKIMHGLNLNKCGHTGTLDPDAEGVLIVACNQATKLMPFLVEHTKEYITTIVFGFETDTLDISGTKTIVYKDNICLSINDINNALELLKEKNEQIPPMYSSIKINGKKLYEYAREGKNIELSPRNVKIYESSIIDELKFVDGFYEIKIKLKVSKGFYVRSFARDLGRLVGCYATMKELLRTKTGNFQIENSHTVNDIINKNIRMISIEEVFPDFEKIIVNDYISKLVKNGVTLDERQIKTNKPFLIYNNNKLIAVYNVVDKYKYKPVLIIR